MLAGNRVRGDDDLLEGAGMWCVDSAVRIQKSMLIGNSMRRRRVKPEAVPLHCTDCKVKSPVCNPPGQRSCWRWRRALVSIWCLPAAPVAKPVTDNALFAASGEGAGVYCEDSAAQLGGSVIAGNSAHSGVGGELYVRGYSATARSSCMAIPWFGRTIPMTSYSSSNHGGC